MDVLFCVLGITGVLYTAWELTHPRRDHHHHHHHHRHGHHPRR